MDAVSYFKMDVKVDTFSILIDHFNSFFTRFKGRLITDNENCCGMVFHNSYLIILNLYCIIIQSYKYHIHHIKLAKTNKILNC